MDKIKLYIKYLLAKKPVYIVAIAVGFASVLLAIASYEQRYNLSNIDGISYMSIASQYANGEVDNALNGYWSPMISWLMVPFIWLGIEPALGFRAVNAAAGIFAVAIGAIYAWKVSRHKLVSSLTYVVLATLLIISSYNDSLSPDIIALGWVMLFAVCLAEIFSSRVKTLTAKALLGTGGLIAVVGAAGYFTKLYLLPVFVGVMLVMLIVGVVLLLTKRNKNTGKNISLVVALSMVGLLIIMSPWVWAISDKYGYVTIGSSFSQNVTAKFSTIAPEGHSGSDSSDGKGVPSVPENDRYSLVAPPSDTAVDPSEEKTPYREDIERAQSRPATSGSGREVGVGERLYAYLESRAEHVPYYLKNLTNIWFFTLLAPLAYVVLLVLRARGYIAMPTQAAVSLGVVILTLLVYASGYAAMTTQSSSAGEYRYFLPTALLAVLAFVLMVPYMVAALHKLTKLPPTALLVMIVVVLTASMAMAHPVEMRALQGKRPAPTGLHEASYLMQEDLDIDRGDNVVSNNNRQTHRLSYLLGLSQYDLRRNGKNMDGLNQKEVDLSNESLLEAFREHDIKYYFEFRPEGSPEPDVDDSPRLTLVGRYDVGRLACEDARNAPHEQCVLYVLKHEY